MWKIFPLLNNAKMKSRSRLTDGHIKFVTTISDSSDGDNSVDDEVMEWS
jgi:hypothetical protein